MLCEIVSVLQYTLRTGIIRVN